MIYAVLDTNVLVSALLSRSTDSTIWGLADGGDFGKRGTGEADELADGTTEALAGGYDVAEVGLIALEELGGGGEVVLRDEEFQELGVG